MLANEMSSKNIRYSSPECFNSVGKPINGNVPKRVPSDTKHEPYWFVGQLTMTFPNQKSYIGTGTIIKAKKKGQTGLYVLTCAHNLYDARDGGRAVKVSFQRGLNGQTHPPYPAVEADDWYYPSDYPDNSISKGVDISQLGAELVKQSRALDYGLVKLREKIDVENCPEIMALDDRALQGIDVALIGLYGWENQDDNMYVGRGKVEIVKDQQLGYPISTDRGASGTAVMSEKGIVAVHTHSGLEGDGNNYGRRITKEVIAHVESWQDMQNEQDALNYNVIMTDSGKWLHAPGSDFLFAFLLDDWSQDLKNQVTASFEEALKMTSKIKSAVSETSGEDVVNGLYLLNQKDMTKAMNNIPGMGQSSSVQKNEKASGLAVEINKQFFTAVLAGLGGEVEPLLVYLTQEMGKVQAQARKHTSTENFGTVIGLISVMPILNVPVTSFKYVYSFKETQSWFVKVNCGSAEKYSFDYSYTVVDYNYEKS
ncbi:MAG: trypsin-like serine peptidase [Phormidesmis sp.]